MGTEIGRAAETAVAKHLMKKGYELIEQNWRTKWCEIDLIMKKGKTIYFIEVKYRKTADHGDGFAYISQRKSEQIRFAARLYLETVAGAAEMDSELCVAAVDGSSSTVSVAVV